MALMIFYSKFMYRLSDGLCSLSRIARRQAINAETRARQGRMF